MNMAVTGNHMPGTTEMREIQVIYTLLADLLVLIHLLFILFVVAGSIAVIRWPWLATIHLPAVAWGALVELNGWLCPLTPWENSARHLAGEQGYTGGFIENYIIPIIYPAGLTRDIQIVLGLGVIAINLCVYGYVIFRSLHRSKKL